MGMVFQNYAVWPHKTVFENVVFGLKLRKVPAPEARRRSRRRCAGQPHRARGRYPNELSRRPAAARRARPQPRGRAGDPAARRAAVQPRRQAARAHAHRAQGAAAPHRHHLRLCHPRPGRGARALRPGRRDAAAAGCSNTARRSRSMPIRPNRMVADFMGLVNLVPGKCAGRRTAAADRVAADLALDVASLDGLRPGESVDVAIRPENIRLCGNGRRRRRRLAKITNHVFLGNISEYYAACGPARCCGCRPIRCSISTSAMRCRRVDADAMQRLPRERDDGKTI